MMIRFATDEDLDLLIGHDPHIAVDVLRRKIANSEVYVLTAEGDIIGWLWYGLFWDLLPFMNMLYLLEPYRRQGLGRQLVDRWEEDMRDQGHNMALTSTQADEEAQHFYRRLGYVDSGVLLLPGDPAEIILRKDIASR